MLIYFFCAVFINLYSKTKHSNETFHLEFYSLSNVFSYRKRISSKSNKSVLTISGKSRNIKIMDPSLLLLSPPQAPPPPILLSTLPFYGIFSIFSEFQFIMTPSHFKTFFRNTKRPPPAYLTLPPTIKHRRVYLQFPLKPVLIIH